MEAVFYITFCVFSIICLYEGVKSYRKNATLPFFFLRGGNLKLPGFLSTILSTNVSIGNFLLFVCSWGYFFGLSGIFWFVVNLIVNAVGLKLFLPRFKTYIENKTNDGSVHEFLSLTYKNKDGSASSGVRTLAGIATGFCLLLALVFELHLGTELIAPVIGANSVYLFCCLTTIICLYSALGGFRTVITTDAIQSFAIIIATIGILAFTLNDRVTVVNSYPDFSSSFLNVGYANIFGIIAIGTGWFLVSMDNWQRMCATRSERNVWKGFLIYSTIIILFGVAYGYLGMYDKAIIEPLNMTGHTSGANPIKDLFAGEIPPYILGFFAAAMLMAALSTADTFLIVVGHTIINDYFLGARRKISMHELTSNENSTMLSISRFTIIGMGVFIIIFWIAFLYTGLLKDPISYFFICYSIQYALFAPLIFSNTKKMTSFLGKTSLFLGIVTAVVVGLSSWSLMDKEVEKVWFLSPGEWLSLTPVVTLVVGLLPLIANKITNYKNA